MCCMQQNNKILIKKEKQNDEIIFIIHRPPIITFLLIFLARIYDRRYDVCGQNDETKSKGQSYLSLVNFILIKLY